MLATCSDVSKRAFEEVLKRQETVAALRDDRVVKEILLTEEVMKEIVKEGNVTYGFKETQKAAEAGAIKELLVTDTVIQKTRQEETFAKLDRLMKNADHSGAAVHIISSDHDGGQKLDGLGGIAAILRYKMSW